MIVGISAWKTEDLAFGGALFWGLLVDWAFFLLLREFWGVRFFVGLHWL